MQAAGAAHDDRRTFPLFEEMVSFSFSSSCDGTDGTDAKGDTGTTTTTTTTEKETQAPPEPVYVEQTSFRSSLSPLQSIRRVQTELVRQSFGGTVDFVLVEARRQLRCVLVRHGHAVRFVVQAYVGKNVSKNTETLVEFQRRWGDVLHFYRFFSEISAVLSDIFVFSSVVPVSSSSPAVKPSTNANANANCYCRPSELQLDDRTACNLAEMALEAGMSLRRNALRLLAFAAEYLPNRKTLLSSLFAPEKEKQHKIIEEGLAEPDWEINRCAATLCAWMSTVDEFCSLVCFASSSSSSSCVKQILNYLAAQKEEPKPEPKDAKSHENENEDEDGNESENEDVAKNETRRQLATALLRLTQFRPATLTADDLTSLRKADVASSDPAFHALCRGVFQQSASSFSFSFS
jgi:hypothetical protein